MSGLFLISDSVKGLKEVEKMGKNWIYFVSSTKIIRDERL